VTLYDVNCDHAVGQLPDFVVASSTSLCSAVVHHNHGRDGGCYAKLHERLLLSSFEALEGEIVREGDICDTHMCLQSRHENANIIVPTDALRALAHIEQKAKDLRAALEWVQLHSGQSPWVTGATSEDASSEAAKPAHLGSLIRAMRGEPTALTASLGADFGRHTATMRASADALFGFLPSLPGRLALLQAASKSLSKAVTVPPELHAAAKVATIVERAVERWGMLEACASLVGHVKEAQGDGSGPPDLSVLDTQRLLLLCNATPRWDG